MRLNFAQGKVSQTVAEYEGLLAGLTEALVLGIQKLVVQGDP
jgi:ribonuclease HI